MKSGARRWVLVLLLIGAVVILDLLSLEKAASQEATTASGVAKPAYDENNHLRLPEGIPMDFRASTFSGDIGNALCGEARRGHGPGEPMDLRTGAGSVHIEAEGFSGSIDLEAY